MRFPKMSLSSRRWSGALVALICLTWCVAARAADPNSAVGANAAGAASIHGDAVLHYLDQTIDWYHRVVALDQAQVDSQQLLYRDGVRSSAEQILKLAFDFARAEAAILDSHTKQSTTSAASAGTAARLKLAAETAAQRVIDLKAQLSDSYRSAMPSHNTQVL